jgi:hypothetical protein
MRRAPAEREVDGVKLEGLWPGKVVDVSSTLGAWLVAQGYADAEMRSAEAEASDFSDIFKATPERAEPSDSTVDYSRRASDRPKRRE